MQSGTASRIGLPLPDDLQALSELWLFDAFARIVLQWLFSNWFETCVMIDALGESRSCRQADARSPSVLSAFPRLACRANPRRGRENGMTRPTYQVTELLGDGIGAELSRAIHRLAEALPIALEFRAVDLRLENRRANQKTIYDEAVEAVEGHRVALKYPTTTAEESPNAILRRRLDLSVIHRPVYTIPGVPTNFRRELDLDIVRIATGGTYDDPGRMIGDDGAVSLRIVERRPVSEAARYAFNLARKTGKKVTSSSKYTIQKATDGLFERVTTEVAGRFRRFLTTPNCSMRCSAR